MSAPRQYGKKRPIFPDTLQSVGVKSADTQRTGMIPLPNQTIAPLNFYVLANRWPLTI